jgi:ATP-dependent Clp protease ATP-binding subunit ClpB
LDEIEKAHPDTFNILLQVLDDGRLTDNKGRVANFKNTLIIMTSNMGSDVILENFEDLQAVGEEHRAEILETTKNEVFELLKDQLRPEFLNRIDEKIMFLPLTKEEIKMIAKLLLKKVRKNLARQELSLELSEKAWDLVAELGYDPQFGARPLKRVIEQRIVNELAKKVLGGDLTAGETIYVDADKDGFDFSETGFSGDGSAPPTKEKSENGSKGKKSKQLKELEKATKDLEDTVKEINEDKGKKPPKPELDPGEV